jgi:hypothetical protein
LIIALLLALCLAIIQFFDQPAVMTHQTGTTDRKGPTSLAWQRILERYVRRYAVGGRPGREVGHVDRRSAAEAL